MSLSIFQLTKLKLDFNFESFFQEDNPHRQFFDQHKKVFGYDNDYLMVIFQSQHGIFDQVFLEMINIASNDLKSVEGVEQLISPLEFQYPIKSPLGISGFPVIHINDTSQYASDSLRLTKHSFYSQYLDHSEQALMVVLQHRHFTSTEEEKLFLDNIEAVFGSVEPMDYALVGRISAQYAFTENIGKDFVFFTALALLVSALVLLLIYRNFSAVFMPYLVAVSSLIATFGLMALFDLPLGVLSVLLPIIILFVSTSDAIHLMNAYHRVEGDKNRLWHAVKEVCLPTFLTTVTTAIGFFSLLSIPNQPIQELGSIAGLAVLLAFLINYTLGPLLLNKRILVRMLIELGRPVVLIILRNRKWVLISSFIVVLLSFWGIRQLHTDAYLLMDLPEGDTVRKDFELVDDAFGGSKPWEMAIWPTDSVKGGLWNAAFLTELHQIHAFIQDSLGFKRTTSLIEWIKFGHQANKGGSPSNFQFPSNTSELNQAIKTAQIIARSRGELSFVNTEKNYGRLLAFIPDWGANLTNEKNEKLQQFIQLEIDPEVLQARITGTTFLIDTSNEMVSMYLLKGLFIAVILISVLLVAYFRSWKLLLISMVPNLLPLLLTAGIMGYMQVPIKLSSTIIFVVAFGIAVDDTIHFISAYKRNRKTQRPIWALMLTFRRTAFSIVITTLTIVSGFSLFIFSNFATTYYLGLFLSIALLLALLIDLLLLPLLLAKE